MCSSDLTKPRREDDVHRRIHSVNGAWPGPLGYFGMHGHYMENGKSWVGYDMIWHAVLPAVVAALERAWRSSGRSPPQLADGDVYLFGVAQGESMRKLHSYWPEKRIFGFDSFVGLPEEDHASSRIDPWKSGKFRGRWNETKLINTAGGPGIARVIKGFFNESLSPALAEREHMRPAFYVDIDCDLHVSTTAALDFLFANGLVRVGTLIAYDDWWTIPCHQFHTPPRQGKGRAQPAQPVIVSPLEVGEGLAHREIASKYGVVFRCLAGPCQPVADFARCNLYNNWGPVFLVMAIGADRGEHGFNFTSEEESHWVRHMVVCPEVH